MLVFTLRIENGIKICLNGNTCMGYLIGSSEISIYGLFGGIQPVWEKGPTMGYSYVAPLKDINMEILMIHCIGHPLVYMKYFKMDILMVCCM